MSNAGYVDVAAGSRFELRHKGPCLFEFRPVGDIFRAVKVSGLAAAAEFNAEGGTVLQKSSGTAATSVAISYRFQLAPGVTAGAYAWPLVADRSSDSRRDGTVPHALVISSALHVCMVLFGTKYRKARRWHDKYSSPALVLFRGRISRRSIYGNKILSFC